VGGDQFIGVLAGDGGDVDHYHDDERRGEPDDPVGHPSFFRSATTSGCLAEYPLSPSSATVSAVIAWSRPNSPPE